MPETGKPNYRVHWVSVEDDGCFSCQAVSIEDALTKSIQAGVCSVDWSSVWELKSDGWQEVKEFGIPYIGAGDRPQ